MRCANGLNCDIAQPVHEKVPRAVPGNVQDDGYAVREVQGGNRVDDIRFLPPLQLYGDGEVRGPSLEQVREKCQSLLSTPYPLFHSLRRGRDDRNAYRPRSPGNARLLYNSDSFTCPTRLGNPTLANDNLTVVASRLLRIRDHQPKLFHFYDEHTSAHALSSNVFFLGVTGTVAFSTEGNASVSRGAPVSLAGSTEEGIPMGRVFVTPSEESRPLSTF